jgi:hypothetical protein
MKMEQTECSETSAYKIQTPGNYPEENIQHTEHDEGLKSRTPNFIIEGTFKATCFSSIQPSSGLFKEQIQTRLSVHLGSQVLINDGAVLTYTVGISTIELKTVIKIKTRSLYGIVGTLNVPSIIKLGVFD